MDQHVDEAVRQVLIYHDATKHHPRRYARSLGYLDWATQPDPFRRYADAPVIPLLVGPRNVEPAYVDLFSPGSIPREPMNRGSVSALFECALGLSAWKSYKAATWALRCNPSSGNLHPTEGYAILGPTEELTEVAGVFHYAPREHVLERRRVISTHDWNRIRASAGVEADAPFCIVGLSSVLWREAWKYGERAFRYCQHDVGHALAALRFSAARLGWALRVVHEAGDDDIACILGLDRAADFENTEREHPDLLAVVSAGGRSSAGSLDLVTALCDAARGGEWRGKSNLLSRDHVPWEIIDMVADATHRPRDGEGDVAPGTEAATDAGGCNPHPGPLPEREREQDAGARIPSRTCSEASNPHPGLLPERDMESHSAREIILRRRSAVSFDAATSIPKETFYAMLARTLPGAPPWDAVNWPVSVHLALFVHRVDGLRPGLYVLAREAAKVSLLRTAMQKDFDWQSPPECPPDLPLFFLYEADCRQAAAQLSLGQDIAGDSAFSLGMFAELEGVLQREGPWAYRRLYWEAGMIGQVLYLEAEAAAVRLNKPIRATGIGAYFDDLVHEVFGLSGHGLQSLYHFTLGGAVDDERLTTLPPYGEEVTNRS